MATKQKPCQSKAREIWPPDWDKCTKFKFESDQKTNKLIENHAPRHKR
jgi:hypothetical protein